MKKWLLLFVLVALPITSQAQKIGQEKPNPPPVQLKKVAVLPMAFREGDKEATNGEAIGAYKSALIGTFEKLGMEVVDQSRVNATWRELNGSLFETAKFELPKPEMLVSLGRKLGADYVVVTRCLWRVRSVWVGVGPKTKANATIDLWIVDIAKSEYSLKADSIKSDSTEKEPGWKTAGTGLALPVSFVSGGPKTPHSKRSGVLSLMKALEPWIEKQAPDKIKINSGKL